MMGTKIKTWAKTAKFTFICCAYLALTGFLVNLFSPSSVLSQTTPEPNANNTLQVAGNQQQKSVKPNKYDVFHLTVTGKEAEESCVPAQNPTVTAPANSSFRNLVCLVMRCFRWPVTRHGTGKRIALQARARYYSSDQRL